MEKIIIDQAHEQMEANLKKLDGFIKVTQERLDILNDHIERETDAIQIAEAAWERSRDAMLEFITTHNLASRLDSTRRTALIKAADWEELQQNLRDAASTARPVA